MTEDTENLILHILCEIRGDQQGIRGDTQDLRGRMAHVERRLDEMNESMVTALGMAAHANVVVESSGQRFDELLGEIAALKRRVADREARQ